MRAYVDRWLARRAELGRRSVYHDEKRVSRYVIPPFGDARLDEITPSQISAWVAALCSYGLSPRSVGLCYALLRGIFRSAMVEGLIGSSPCMHGRESLPASKDVDPHRRERALISIEGLRSLTTSSLIPVRRQVLYGLGAFAGLRAGEAAAVTHGSIDWAASPLPCLTVSLQFCPRTRSLVPTKTGIPRFIPMHPRLVALVEKCDRGLSDDVPLTLTVNGRRWSSWSATQELEKDCARVGLERHTMHHLRLSFLSHAQNNGAPREIIRRTTHARPTDIVERYTQIEYATLCAAVLKIPI